MVSRNARQRHKRPKCHCSTSHSPLVKKETSMQLGFVSAILPELSLEEVLQCAAEIGYDCVEVMCWPRGRAERAAHCLHCEFGLHVHRGSRGCAQAWAHTPSTYEPTRHHQQRRASAGAWAQAGH